MIVRLVSFQKAHEGELAHHQHLILQLAELQPTVYLRQAGRAGPVCLTAADLRALALRDLCCWAGGKIVPGTEILLLITRELFSQVYFFCGSVQGAVRRRTL